MDENLNFTNSKKLSSKNDVPIIAEIDSSSNTIPKRFNAERFPIIYYIDGSGKAEKYVLGREVDDMFRFLMEKQKYAPRSELHDEL